jgi:acyl-CoA synthetase (AMP-forming)/AMP-acid ligase II
MGYWGNPEATNRVLKPNPLLPVELGDVEKVCYSGDLVRTDEDGFLYYVGRRDAMIKSSGIRISPTEVEEVAFKSGRVRHAAAIGVPDPLLGQVVKLFVVPRDGEPVDRDAVLAFCEEKMPRYMVPKFLEVLPELPKTSSGKIDYPALRRREGFA